MLCIISEHPLIHLITSVESVKHTDWLLSYFYNQTLHFGEPVYFLNERSCSQAQNPLKVFFLSFLYSLSNTATLEFCSIQVYFCPLSSVLSPCPSLSHSCHSYRVPLRNRAA